MVWKSNKKICWLGAALLCMARPGAER